MLMTKFTYSVKVIEGGVLTTVVRSQDGAVKTFFNAGHTKVDGLVWLMESITDDQADGYFPKPRKK